MMARMYTGNDGQTHFEDLHLPVDELQNVAIQAGANIVFRRFSANYFSDWHTAPRRQYIFILSGQMEIGLGDGTSRRFGPGDGGWPTISLGKVIPRGPWGSHV